MKQWYNCLVSVIKGRTVIVIAHRMRTIANADKIVVLDKGKVTEVGTPSELAKKGGLYAHLVALQQNSNVFLTDMNVLRGKYEKKTASHHIG